MDSLGGKVQKVGKSAFSRRKGRGGPRFSALRKENIDIVGKFGHFRAQKVSELLNSCSKQPYVVVLNCFKRQ
jgi:hypothetical protein